MERKEFLRSIGAGAAFALTFPCMNGCSNDSEDGGNRAVPSGVDFTFDLTSPEARPLVNNGGFVFVESNVGEGLTDILVARNLEGELVAASQICSHEGYAEVRFLNQDGGIFWCNVHGSRFNQDGSPLNTITSNPLKIFNTELMGDNLRIFE